MKFPAWQDKNLRLLLGYTGGGNTRKFWHLLMLGGAIARLKRFLGRHSKFCELLLVVAAGLILKKARP